MSPNSKWEKLSERFQPWLLQGSCLWLPEHSLRLLPSESVRPQPSYLSRWYKQAMETIFSAIGPHSLWRLACLPHRSAYRRSQLPSVPHQGAPMDGSLTLLCPPLALLWRHQHLLGQSFLLFLNMSRWRCEAGPRHETHFVARFLLISNTFFLLKIFQVRYSHGWWRVPAFFRRRQYPIGYSTSGCSYLSQPRPRPFRHTPHASGVTGRRLAWTMDSNHLNDVSWWPLLEYTSDVLRQYDDIENVKSKKCLKLRFMIRNVRRHLLYTYDSSVGFLSSFPWIGISFPPLYITQFHEIPKP